MTGLVFFFLTVVINLVFISTTDGYYQFKCPMPCVNKRKTSCPSGYHCDLSQAVCVQSYDRAKCYEVGLARLYNGIVSKTAKGITCQRWDSKTPHKPYSSFIVALKFPERSVEEASNFCRDPSSTGRPWCYTTDPNDRWDYCDIPPCSGRNCYRTNYAFLYEGNTAESKDKLTCQRWDTNCPQKHKYTDPEKFPDISLKDASNFCRSPEKSPKPWCYTTTKQRWQYCDITECPYNYCYEPKVSWKYIGTQTRTQNGYLCQSWVSRTPHNHKYWNMDIKYPEGSAVKAKNYCRDPSWSGKPWCYTTDAKKRWDWCCINKCSEMK